MNHVHRVSKLTCLCATLSLLVSLPTMAETVQYAGSLMDGGKPADGVFDLRMQLYNAAQGGESMGEAITLYGVTVENGRFSVPVQLSQPLPKQGSVWLEAQLKAPDGGGFQALQGRQEIQSALGGGICWETAGNIGLSTGILGADDAGVPLIALRNSTTNLYLRRNGGIVPGVPHEMKGLMTEEVLPRLLQYFTMPAIVHRTAFTAGQGESMIAERLIDFEAKLPAHIKLAYLPSYGMVKLRLTAQGEKKELVEKEVAPYFAELLERIAPFLVSDADEGLEVVIGKIRKQQNRTLATVESCTGGYIAHLITSVSGSSAYYKGSIVSFANEVKENLLHVF